MKRGRMILLFFILCPLLSGCFDSNEPERMVYLHGLGIDYKDGKFHGYLQYINVGSLAKSESAAAPSKEKIEVGHVSGRNIDEAMFNVYPSTQIRVFWGHLKYIVISKAALENKGLEKVLDLFDRYRETRYRIWMYSTEEDIKEVLHTYQPLQITSTLTELGEPINSYKQNSLLQPKNMRELLIAIQQPGQNGLLPQVSLTQKDMWQEDHKNLPAIDVSGMALVTKEKLLGFLTDDDIGGYQWVTEKSKRSGVTVEKDGQPMATVVIEKSKVNIKPSLIGDKIHFTINLKYSGLINELNQQIEVNDLAAAAAAQIKEDIIHTYSKALAINGDIYELGEVLHKKNNKLWKQLNENGRVPLEEDSISVNISLLIKHSGKLRPVK
ncbi:Ger(x)C family spore germination protein [Ectobacillus polymachus]|uniref:Ger(x)C family spore germination protein n=1 Tax=Ectobacillus polymachus TaxID=1508806 RepID=UPI003A871A9D